MSSGSAFPRSAGLLAGLPALAALLAATVYLAEPLLRAELVARAEPLVLATGTAEGEPWLRIEAAGRDLTARGEAPGSELRETTLRGLSSLPGVRRLVSRVDLIGEQAPFVWTVRLREAARLDLAGYRPSEIGRAAFAKRIGEALPPGTAIRDNAAAARGSPPDFVDAAAFVASQVARLAPGASASLADGVLSLRGEAPSVAAYEQVMAALRAPPSTMRVETIEIEAPLVKPFAWSLVRGETGFSLAGYVRSEQARQEFLAAVAAGSDGLPVRDLMRPGRGLDPSIDPRTLYATALSLAALLQDGTVSLEGTRLSVRGDALDGQAITEIGALMGRLPSGLERGDIAVTSRPPSPYRLSVRRTADAVVLTGHLPDAATREELLSGLRPLFFGERVIDRSRVANGAPPGFASIVASGIGQLALLASGEVLVEDRSLRVSGQSLYGESAERARATIPALAPAGWTAHANITVPGRVEPLRPEPCREQFAARIGARSLRFSPGSTDLTADFYPVLDDLASLARTCPSLRVEVAGHRDPPGAQAAAPKPETAGARSPPSRPAGKTATKDAKPAAAPAATPAATSEPDPGLPARRAATIVDYLLKAGVAPDRIVASPEGGDARQVGWSLRG